MPLINITNLQLHYGEQIIFDDVNLQLDNGQRLCIVGRNGVGKSTLLKVIEGSVVADSGAVWRASSVVVASLAQDLPEPEKVLVRDFVAGGVAPLLHDMQEYDQALKSGDMKKIERLHDRIDSLDGWSVKNRIEQVLTRLELDGDKVLASLSGGWRRRAALAKALVTQPDILLLDEPTNHLDIAAIQWLEAELISFSGAIVFITHDRTFLQSVANQIGELDRGAFALWQGDYAGFLRFRQEQLESQARRDALFDKKLAQEEIWIRQGIKARRTRNEGRVRALKKMREARAGRREQAKVAKMVHADDMSSGKLVAEMRHLGFTVENKRIIDDFNSVIIRGDKVGLIGPNGIGKSTLLKLILGELQPSEGIIRRGTRLSVAYFDQLRAQLDLNKSAMDNIAEGRETIDIGGKKKHVISYLQDFLFSGERARTAIGTLSGGERNRILLAKLFSKPSNLLVLDEPTNDLDSETLELLEEMLVNYEGTVLLVSHDRSFLNNVVTSTYAFEGGAKIREYVGGYEDWLRQGGVWPENSAVAEAPAKIERSTREGVSKPRKLSYKLQRELDGLPAKLEKLEGDIAALEATLAAPGFYQQDSDTVTRTLKQLEEKQALLSQDYGRWETLESMQSDMQ